MRQATCDSIWKNVTSSKLLRDSITMRSQISALKPSTGSSAHRYGTICKSENDLNESSIPDECDNITARTKTKILMNSKKWWLATITVGVLVTISSILFCKASVNDNPPIDDTCMSTDRGYQCQPALSHHWGQYSPYFSVASETTPHLPDQCQITFAQILSRHGARDPTRHSTEKYRKLIDKIHLNATSYSNEFAFIKNYKYLLGADQLSRFGQTQMIDSGKKFYDRYKSLARRTIPFIRASGQARVIESAQNWTQGFHEARLQNSSPNDEDNYPYDILIISEDKGSNNTLDHGRCQEFEEGALSEIGSSAKSIWASVFTPSIIARLNSKIPGVTFTEEEVISLMSMCPFETVAHKWGKISPFCKLFSEGEWHAYEYYHTLGKYYKYSWGNPLGPTQGVGFTNELIARMTKMPVEDHTMTNSTLDSDPKTFPIDHDTVLYADFSHDNTMISIFSALGLYNSTPPLDNMTFQDANALKGFSTSWIVPFASRAYVEKMKCVGTEEELVRIIVNDRVIPLDTCNADALYRCKLNDFITSLNFARIGGRWDRC